MTNRLPPGGAPPSIDEISSGLMRMSIDEIDRELIRIPNTLLPKIKEELAIPQEKDLAAMTTDEKQRIFALYRENYRNQTQPGPSAPQQPPNPPGPSYQSMTGFDPQMNQGMVSIQTPGTVNSPMHITPEVDPMKNYRQSMRRLHQQLSASQPGPGQGLPTDLAPVMPSAPPSTGADATPSLINLQQPGIGGLGDPAWDISDFDQSFLRQDPGDINFERDFGRWFNPAGDVTLQQPGIRDLGDLTWDISDFDQSFLRQDPGDINFERDFGRWFNPGGDVT